MFNTICSFAFTAKRKGSRVFKMSINLDEMSKLHLNILMLLVYKKRKEKEVEIYTENGVLTRTRKHTHL
jgi:hypothetical protein